MENIGIKLGIQKLLDLSDDEFEDVIDKANDTFVKKGTTLFREGKQNDNVYIISSGKAEIYKEGQFINLVTKGDLLGEMSLVGADKSTATVIAKTDMQVYKFKKHRFEMLLNKYPKMNQAIVLLTISRKLQQHEITPNINSNNIDIVRA